MSRVKVYKDGISLTEFIELPKKSRRALFNSALRGNEYNMNAVKILYRELQLTTNRRLRSFEKHDVAYGATYNRMMHFLDTQYDTNRVPSYTKMKRYKEALYQNAEHMTRFLKMSKSDWKGVVREEKFLLKKYKERGVLPKTISYRDSKEFLKFLGNESTSASIDTYGTSGDIVKLLYKEYKNRKDKSASSGHMYLKLMERAFTEFQAGEITFDNAMDRGGIKVEDYLGKRPTS